MEVRLEFKIAGGDFTIAGSASSEVKKVLKKLGISSNCIKRTVVALYEAEMNVVAHAYSGKMIVTIGEGRIEALITDHGPGIEDIEQAMQEGFSTATTRVREMGFGAGMGLSNIKKNADELEITSQPGKGTQVKIVNNLND
jgi:serine/threonine-protein kinase RsbT